MNTSNTRLLRHNPHETPSKLLDQANGLSQKHL